MYDLQILQGQFSGIQLLILDLEDSTDSNFFFNYSVAIPIFSALNMSKNSIHNV